jgi:methylated-DNA-[protein]-cysteine S-methyltransferase
MAIAAISRTITVFDSALGWMAVVGSEDVVEQLVFNYDSPQAAQNALHLLGGDVDDLRFTGPLVDLLRSYAEGREVDFRTIRIQYGPITAFRRRVLEACRKIPYGKTLTYGRLAAKVGAPGAARAVGNCMAANRVPLIVPCHRVVLAGGAAGPYSGWGPEMKRRLLALETGKSSRDARPVIS